MEMAERALRQRIEGLLVDVESRCSVMMPIVRNDQEITLKSGTEIYEQFWLTLLICLKLKPG